MSRNSHWKCSIKNAVLMNFAIFRGRNLSWSLYLIKLFQYRCFPVNNAKFLRTPTFKNICKQLLLNVTFNSNEEQHLLVKLDEMGLDIIVLCLFISFWYYYICILSRSSCTDVFFKKLFLKN